ncbi:MAG: CBS domain-containing protein [Betaproteobacteria bacterium]|nr:CBS domain-containing protein [Betaproteobacteria bacterium]
MDRTFTALPIRELGPGAGFRRPLQALAARVASGSPALEVMTDLTRASPATIRPQAPVDAANQFMIARGVRLLLVADDRETVLGVISAADILGEKPVQAATERGLRRAELTVGDIMTSAERLEVLAFADLEGARVGHIVETLRRCGRQHALVVDSDGGRLMVRGIFSLSQIARQLGLPLHTSEVARTFAEIEAALAR